MAYTKLGSKRIARSRPHFLAHAPIPRLKRCGASDEQLDAARSEWRKLTGPERIEAAMMLDALSDAELREQIAEGDA